MREIAYVYWESFHGRRHKGISWKRHSRQNLSRDSQKARRLARQTIAVTHFKGRDKDDTMG